MARGVFSNEAGLGSAPIAHAAAKTKGPVSQGLVAMLGTFIDTIIVCSFTALAILSTGVWTSGATGAALTSLAFEVSLPGFGGPIIAISLAIPNLIALVILLPIVFSITRGFFDTRGKSEDNPF